MCHWCIVYTRGLCQLGPLWWYSIKNTCTLILDFIHRTNSLQGQQFLSSKIILSAICQFQRTHFGHQMWRETEKILCTFHNAVLPISFLLQAAAMWLVSDETLCFILNNPHDHTYKNSHESNALWEVHTIFSWCGILTLSLRAQCSSRNVLFCDGKPYRAAHAVFCSIWKARSKKMCFFVFFHGVKSVVTCHLLPNNKYQKFKNRILLC